MQFVSFYEDLIPAAVELLAERQNRERQVFPELSTDCTEVSTLEKALKREWKEANTTGIAAMEGTELVGYMFGRATTDEYSGRNSVIRYPGFAIAGNQSEELCREMYAHLAGRWVEKGYFDHYAFVPAGNQALLEAWFKLGFAYQQVYGLLDLDNFQTTAVHGTADFEIRRATPADTERLRQVSNWICSHQGQAPVWCPVMPEMVADYADGYAEIPDDLEALLWLAVKDGEILGFQAYWPLPASEANIIIPENCIELKVGGTNPSVRGQGIGSSLTAYSLNEVKKLGYRYCYADWRMTNLLSSRFWPKQGFRPVMYRLVRQVDPRISWANGR